MNNTQNYRFTVSCRKPMSFEVDAQYNIEIDPREFQEMNPVDICSNQQEAAIFGGITNAQYQSSVKIDRKRFAADIAAKITKSLLDFMESSDTENGYAK